MRRGRGGWGGGCRVCFRRVSCKLAAERGYCGGLCGMGGGRRRGDIQFPLDQTLEFRFLEEGFAAVFPAAGDCGGDFVVAEDFEAGDVGPDVLGVGFYSKAEVGGSNAVGEEFGLHSFV